MGIFGIIDRAREKRLAEMDREYQSARDGLVRAYARRHLVGWNKNFLFLDRISSERPANCDEDTYRILLNQAVTDCASFEDSHEDQSLDLSMVLEDLEQRLKMRILALVSECGYYTNDVREGIRCLTKHGQLPRIIEYISSLEKAIQGNR